MADKVDEQLNIAAETAQKNLEQLMKQVDAAAKPQAVCVDNRRLRDVEWGDGASCFQPNFRQEITRASCDTTLDFFFFFSKLPFPVSISHRKSLLVRV